MPVGDEREKDGGGHPNKYWQQPGWGIAGLDDPTAIRSFRFVLRTILLWSFLACVISGDCITGALFEYGCCVGSHRRAANALFLHFLLFLPSAKKDRRR